MNPLWLMTLTPTTMDFEQHNCVRCGESHELLQSLAQTKLRCRKCSTPLHGAKKTAKVQPQTYSEAASPLA